MKWVYQNLGVKEFGHWILSEFQCKGDCSQIFQSNNMKEDSTHTKK